MKVGAALIERIPHQVLLYDDHVGVLGPLFPTGPFAADWALPSDVLGEIALDEVELLPPVVLPASIIGIGVNYRAHAAEFGREVYPEPFLFRMGANALTGHRAEVAIPPLDDDLDYEGELAVVIGRRSRAVSADTALHHVFGYTIANDISARIKQRANNWVFGKGCDGFLPLGPAIVTADEIPDPQSLTLTTRVNGEQRQHASTGDMERTIAELISYVSSAVTLHPGDIICTGTPSGVGAAFDPPRFLGAGDSVTVDITGIGTLENSIVEETT